MNKERLEFLTDAIYSIVMTLLVIDIRVPHLEHGHTPSNEELWAYIVKLSPLFISFLVSFAVLSTYWIVNHAILKFFVQKIDRAIMYLNFLSLFFISLIPFSAHLLGLYPSRLPSIYFYGFNLLCLAFTAIWIFFHISNRPHLRHPELVDKTWRQLRLRLFLTPMFAVLGMLVAPLSTTLTLFLFAFPIIFNLIPGTLNTLEKVFGFEV